MFLILSGLAALGQTSNPPVLPWPATNVLADGSIVKIETVSYGILHRIPPYEAPGEPPRGDVSVFKSAYPTIMFTTSRHIGPNQRYLDYLWTRAEALDASGHWYPLSARREPKPDKDGKGDDVGFYEGPSPSEMWEIWEFPHSLEASPWLRVRIGLTRDGTNYSKVEFKIPNDEKWREQSVKEQTNGFNQQAWLDGELWNIACEGDADYLKELIGQGANPNSCDFSGMSALAIACQDGRLKVVRYLLDHGADVNAHSKGKGTDRTALIAAASMDGNDEIMHLLVERGAALNTPGEEGWTALVWAARDGNMGYVKYLLSKGANPNVKGSDGKSIIQLAKETDNPSRFKIIKILKEAQKAH